MAPIVFAYERHRQLTEPPTWDDPVFDYLLAEAHRLTVRCCAAMTLLARAHQAAGNHTDRLRVLQGAWRLLRRSGTLRLGDALAWCELDDVSALVPRFIAETAQALAEALVATGVDPAEAQAKADLTTLKRTL